MLNIELDKDYRVVADQLNYILQKKTVAQSGKNEGEIVWVAKKYHSTLEKSLIVYKELLIKESDATTIDEVLELIKKIDLHISKILQGI